MGLKKERQERGLLAKDGKGRKTGPWAGKEAGSWARSEEWRASPAAFTHDPFAAAGIWRAEG